MGSQRWRTPAAGVLVAALALALHYLQKFRGVAAHLPPALAGARLG